MTRINAGMPVKSLTNKHLLAEHREIKRIPNLVKRLVKDNRLNLSDKPDKFTLGKGHVKFFYDKLLFLKKRYIDIYNECIERGFKVESYLNSWSCETELLLKFTSLNKDWVETPEAKALIEERIREKMKPSK